MTINVTVVAMLGSWNVRISCAPLLLEKPPSGCFIINNHESLSRITNAHEEQLFSLERERERNIWNGVHSKPVINAHTKSKMYAAEATIFGTIRLKVCQDDIAKSV